MGLGRQGRSPSHRRPLVESASRVEGVSEDELVNSAAMYLGKKASSRSMMPWASRSTASADSTAIISTLTRASVSTN